MNFPAFGIGFIFAFAEVSVRKLFDQGFRPSARALLTDIVLDLPPFLSFAFLAGVAADWLRDLTNNHSIEMLVAVIVWLLCLVIRETAEHNSFGLKGLWLQPNYNIWKVSVALLLVVGFVLGIVQYFIWNNIVKMEFKPLTICTIVVFIFYAGCVYKFVNRSRDWTCGDCLSAVTDIVNLYCKTSPDTSGYLSVNPAAHSAQGCDYLRAKFVSVRDQKIAADRCLCLEEELTRKLRDKLSLAEKEICEIVRCTVKEKASQLQLEYHVLGFIVGNAALHQESSDFLSKNFNNGNAEKLELFGAMRKTVERANAFFDLSIN